MNKFIVLIRVCYVGTKEELLYYDDNLIYIFCMLKVCKYMRKWGQWSTFALSPIISDLRFH